ncbi:hypothetical protein DFJ74DRAFT_692793 [Hyaloraphidium curvatum]|nr:hypothetical protein DFJ74DRAFT_692793 [Hyaloraphidium curvatum]
MPPPAALPPAAAPPLLKPPYAPSAGPAEPRRRGSVYSETVYSAHNTHPDNASTFSETEVASTAADLPAGDIDVSPVSAHKASDPVVVGTPFTMSAKWFTSPEVHAVEQEAVFRRGWTYACHLSVLYPNGRVAGTVEGGTCRQLHAGGIDYFLARVRGEWKGYVGIAPGRGRPMTPRTELRTDFGRELRELDCGILTPAEVDLVAETFVPIRIHITIPSNLVFVNLTPADEPCPTFLEYFGDFEDTLREYEFDGCELYSTWRSVCDFNWKTWVDGYSECYHCPGTHPSLNRDYAIQFYKVEPVENSLYCRHSCPRRDELPADACGRRRPPKQERSGWGDATGLWLYAFPGLSLNCFSLGFYTIKVVPLSAGRTMLEREIFVRRSHASPAVARSPLPTQHDVEQFMYFMKQVGEEDYELCELANLNLERGVYSRGVLHPSAELGVIWYQSKVREVVESWLRKRRAA